MLLPSNLLWILLFFIQITSGRRLRLNFRNVICSPDDICVDVDKCPQNSQWSTDLNLISLVQQFLQRPYCSSFLEAAKVCCPKQHFNSIPSSNVVLNRMADVSVAKRSVLPYEICGRINNREESTSTKTNIGEFPWIALIVYNTNNSLNFKCTGSIITEYNILTAAHCILKPEIVGVRLGEYNLEKTEDCDGAKCSRVQDFYIEKFHIHPQYDSKSLKNDIAMIQLATPANFSIFNVQPICLPSASDKTELVGKTAFVSGWGLTDTGYTNSELLKFSIPILPITNCQQLFTNLELSSSIHICAGYEVGGGIFSGDSGGPLNFIETYKGTSRYVQHGIVSLGSWRNKNNISPEIYTRVSFYLDWILQHIK